MASRDRLVWVTYNGEIYNYRELRRELELGHGSRFQTQSDTEVLLEGYRVWGIDFIARLNGIFAFALVDLQTSQVWLVRDRLGIKPLYYAIDGDRVAFASEQKALGSTRRKLDLGAVDRLLTYRYVPSPGTLLENVFKLPPAHVLEISPRGRRTWCYWKERAAASDRPVDLDDAVEEYRSALVQAVRRQLVSDVPVGLYLSSGIDSTALLALMRRELGEGIPTFTIGFRGHAGETDDAAEIARTFQAKHTALEVSEQDYIDTFERYIWHLEEPVANESAPAGYFLSKLARPEVKVVLNGQGADELWGGYGRYLGEQLSSVYRKLPRVVTGWAIPRLAQLLPRSERLRRGAFAMGEPDTLQRFLRIYSIFTPEMKQRLYRSPLRSIDPAAAMAPLLRFASRANDADTLNTMLHIDLRMSLPDDLLLCCDKLSMAHSVEVRVPYLDHELVELVERWPSRMKLRHGRAKVIHKRALASLVPASVLHRKKKGFANPLAAWLGGPLQGWARSLLLGDESRVLGLFERDAVRDLLDAHLAGRGAYMRQLYLLVSLEVWLRRFDPIGSGP